MAINRENDPNEQQPNRAHEQAARSAEQPLGRGANKPNDQPTVGEAKAGLAAGEGGGEKKRAPFSVAPGKSVSTQRGIIEAGSEIKAEDVGGQPNLDRLIEKGAVVKS